MLAFVPDYKINLISPASMEDADFGKLQTMLKEVLAFIKYSQDEVKLKEVLAKDEVFHHLGRNEVEVYVTVTGRALPENAKAIIQTDSTEIAERRKMVQSLKGIIPADIDLDAKRAERIVKRALL